MEDILLDISLKVRRLHLKSIILTDVYGLWADSEEGKDLSKETKMLNPLRAYIMQCIYPASACKWQQ